MAAVSAFMLQPAVASHDVDVDTIGIGDARNTASDAPASSADRMRAASADTESVSSSARRSITVNDPDPVIVISAYDATNASTVAAAMALGTTDPLPTAPHIMPDESDGWSLGNASAYSHADNDDGKGNFGTDVTASGVPLSSEGLTVAVPESQAHLLGHAVALRYGETIIVATVTDTGGFESYGRALDLAPGCWKAFGVTDVHDWGVRSVYYKFL
ncbi:hypothetical protein [Slackia faecicanis]|uniref:hypothetical protein n=1 Tax=Slackia faecicanis TaxID=255723 RepID=UPI001FCEF2AD|nr:hypothetical protein [Slackia faecicanis]